MTVARLLTGKVVTQNGAVGVAPECCYGCGGTGPDGCGCPAATITFNVTVVIPEPDPSNDPGGFPYPALVPGNTYTATLVMEFSGLTEAIENGCLWWKCADTDQATEHGIYVQLYFNIGGSYPTVSFGFEPNGVTQPDQPNGFCGLAGSNHTLGSPTPNAGTSNASPSVQDVVVPGDPMLPCEWPATMSGSQTLINWDGCQGLDIDFSWEITFA